MDARVFLTSVLPNEGSHCIFAALKKEGKIKQKFYSTVDGMVGAADDLDRNGFDAYFSLSTFENADSREAENVKLLKSFFLDLDCGDGKNYVNQNQALGDLRYFCKELTLPKPTMVSSGYGIHVYWILREPVSYAEWLPVAHRIKQQCKELGLMADPSVTADAARVLRIPGTRNYKYDTEKDVFVFNDKIQPPVDFDEFSDLFGGESAPVPSLFDGVAKPAALDTNERGSSVMDLLAGNIQGRFKTILDKTMAGRGCEQIKIILTQQEDIQEPLWRAGLSIAKFCVDGDKAAHLMSSRHPGYDPEDTEYKMGRIKGPYLCTKFDEFNPGVCGDCKLFKKIKSPIVLGKEIIEATEEDNIIAPGDMDSNNTRAKVPQSAQQMIPPYPKPYFRGAKGGVYIRSINADGEVEERAIYHNDLYVVRRLRDIEMGESVVMRLHLPKDGIREFTVPLTAVTSREEFRRHMSMQGVAVSKMDDIMKYTTDWVNELQAQSIADEARRQFGWTDDATSFILGPDEHTKDGVFVNHPSTPTLQFFPAFKPKGTLQGWKDTINFYNKPGLELHQFAVCTAFGSPLMEFIPNIYAAALHIHSKDTGLGKTTALFAACTVWGNPKDLVLIDQDTKNFKMNRGEIYKNLPLYLDEVTNTEPKELSDLAYQFTGGYQRGRMSSGSNQERARGEPWSLLSVTTGNTSFVERISTFKDTPKAEAQRVLETKVSKFNFEGKLETDNLNKGLVANYGHAGPIYLQALLEDPVGIQALLEKVQAKVDAICHLTHENRFWSAFLTCTLTGAIIARRLGLIDFSIEKLFTFAIALIGENRANGLSMNSTVESTLNDYINENHGSILKIRSTEDRRALNKNGLDTLITPDNDPRIKIVARYETDTKKLFLMPKPLKKWCVLQQINYSSFLDDLTKKMGGKRGKVRIGKGTNMSMPPTTVIEVNCAGMLDDDEPAAEAEAEAE